MPGSTYLEDFSLSATLGTDGKSGDSERATELRLAGFESGYDAGYEDALKLSKENENRIESELASAVSNLRFSFQEARSHILNQLAPVVTEIFAKVLPEIAARSLQFQIEDTFKTIIESASKAPVTIHVNPQVRGALSSRLADSLPEPFQIESDPSLSQIEAVIGTKGSGYYLDLDTTVSEILKSVDAFFSLEDKET